MNIIETTFERLPRERLVIGFEGENLRATVRIDCASVFAEYPNATPALIVKPLFADAYPVVVDRNGVCVDWLITSEILSFNGDGEIQLAFYKGDVICKSAVAKIRVSRSLQVTGEMPDPVARWIDDANAKLAEVDAALVSIDEMDAVAHGLPEGSAPTVEVTEVDDHKRISFGIPKGDTGATGAKGDKGDRGEVGATPQIGIGNVQTLPAGSSATASMSGTTENPLLNLGIPMGERGLQGIQGEKGDTGATGATGATPDFSIGTVSTLPAGSSATAEITGTAENPVLSLGIPQGIQGVQGIQGEKGDPGDGVPAGGITGQVLAKASDTDYDTEWIHVAPVIKNEASGAIASFPDGAEMPVDELKVSIEPVQDLHGYDHPWPAGGGKNLLAPFSNFSANGLTTTANADGSITVSGTATSDGTYITADSPLSKVIPAGTSFVFNLTNSPPATVRALLRPSGASDVGPNNTYAVQTRENDITAVALYLRTVSGTTYNFTIYPMIEIGTMGTAFEPYENICPITGWDGVQIVVSPTTDAEDGQTYSITLPTEAGTVYGGTLDVSTGELVVDRAMIASYNGESLPGEWISDRDVYASGSTPTTGAQVVYTLATPITYTLTPTEIRTLLGQNNIWADTGDVSVKYNADTKLYIDNKITQAIAAALNS